MSQSPLAVNVSDESVLKYRQGWRALNRLLHQDRSFSGRERNCVFINCEGNGFADNSAISGFDFPDDARAVVATDWDFDGDLDVWVSCRNAPRIRLLENRSLNKSDWLAIKLKGDGSMVNKDAIGAKVHVLTDQSDKPIIRTVYAGDGFLSQSGTFLHFGLGKIGKLDKVLVFWPDGTSYEVKGISKSAYYSIKYGDDIAQSIKIPELEPTTESPQNISPEEEEVRIVLPARLPLPDIEELPKIQKPMLLNLWSALCQPCIEELQEWSDNIKMIKEEGLHIQLLNVDIEPPKNSQYPFANSSISLKGIRALDLFQKGVLDRWVDLPLPSSFLMDQYGDVAVVYKGKVSANQVISDFKLLNANHEQRRSMALPFQGLFISPLPKPDPRRISSQFLDADQPKEALSYLEKFDDRYPNDSDVLRMIKILKGGLGIPTDEAAEMMAAANKFREAGDKERAIEVYKKILSRFPKKLKAAYNLAYILATDKDIEVRRPKESRALALRLCKMTNNKNPNYLDLLSMAEASCGNFESAILSVTEAIKMYENQLDVSSAKLRLQLYQSKKTFIK